MKKLPIILFFLTLAPFSVKSNNNCCVRESILIGKKAPSFKAEAVVKGEIITLSLDELKSDFKVLVFYPADFSMVCPTELRGLQEKISAFNERKAQVLGISTDSVFAHKKWLETPKDEAGVQGLTYPLVADITKEISCNYGVLDESGVALRAVFILDKNNIVQYMGVNNLAFGRNIDELVRIIDAIKFTQEHKGDVCPVNWQKGKKTMEATPEGAKEYFQQEN